VTLEGGVVVNVRMTLMAPGCSMGAMISGKIEDKLLGIPGCDGANFKIVWEPAWRQNRISEIAGFHLSSESPPWWLRTTTAHSFAGDHIRNMSVEQNCIHCGDVWE
jgi:hypothetical protein